LILSFGSPVTPYPHKPGTSVLLLATRIRLIKLFAAFFMYRVPVIKNFVDQLNTVVKASGFYSHIMSAKPTSTNLISFHPADDL